MSEVSVLLESAIAGDQQAAAAILPLVYDELRKLAASKMRQENEGHTLGATALVHETYLRLVGDEDRPRWKGRSHFFGAAAEAMRRILVDHARRRTAQKRSSGGARLELDENFTIDELSQTDADEVTIAIHEALDRLAAVNSPVAQLVKLRFFAGLSIPDAAQVLDIAPRTADNWWAYGRAWLADAIETE